MEKVLVSEVARRFHLSFEGEDFLIEGVSAIDFSGPSDISFLTRDFSKKRNAEKRKKMPLGAVFIPRDFDGEIFARAIFRTENPYASMVLFVKNFCVDKEEENFFIDSTAKIHPTAVIEGKVEAGAKISAHAVVSRGSVVGKGCILEPRATLYSGVHLGENCVIQSGAVLGANGFGFFENRGQRFSVPHVGGVVVGKNSSVGANTVIASGFLSPTVIGEDTHIDALVQVGHNCRIGSRVYLAAQCGLAGSTIIGDEVEMGGNAKAAGHLTIGARAKVAANGGVTKNISPGAIVAGFPAEEISKWRRAVVALRQLASSKNHAV